MTLQLTENWFAIALITTAAWALSCVIDACFVGEGIFEQPSDGPVISGLFCLIPAILFSGGANLHNIDMLTAVLAITAALCHLAHLYFYFKALFSMRDVTNAEIFNSLSVLCVPVIAFVLLSERLAPAYYVAVIAAGAGTFVLIRAPLRGVNGPVLGMLSLSVVSVSLAMVLQAWVLQRTSFHNGVVLFASTAFVATAAFMVSVQPRRQRIARVCWRFGWVFVAVQSLELAGLFGSQRATHVGPSVTLVALVECALPLFVMFFSWLLYQLIQHTPSASEALRTTLQLQSRAYSTKTLAVALIGIGIWIGYP